jgi:hypothetical protein
MRTRAMTSSGWHALFGINLVIECAGRQAPAFTAAVADQRPPVKWWRAADTERVLDFLLDLSLRRCVLHEATA